VRGVQLFAGFAIEKEDVFFRTANPSARPVPNTPAATPQATTLVTKLPLSLRETPQGQVEARLSSWDKRRLVGDLSGPLVESGAILGRIVLVSEDRSWFLG
jgi:outer membrane receptor for ferric coprogen and ferric-rhodotorulic acid